MRVGLTRSLLALGLFAFVGSGCEQLGPWWDAVRKDKGIGTVDTGAGGTSAPGMMCVDVDGGGDSTSCKPYDLWKKYGSDACQQKGLQLTNLMTGPSCGGNNYQNATYVCCATPPSGSAGAGGSPGSGGSGGTGGAPGQMCTTNRLSSATSCKSYDLWKQDASATCTQNKLLLTTITPGPACDGGIVGVTFSCCDGPTPSPPPPPTGTGGSSGDQMCTTSEMGGSTSCKPYELWKQYASDACTQQNLVLTGLATGTTCGDGLYQSIKLTCCAPTPSPPPPKCTQTVDATGQVCKTCVDSVTGMVISNDCAPGPGTGTCVTIADGSSSSCKDEATWKKYGTDRCAQQNLPLADLKLDVACAGGYSMVTYVCCAP